MFLTFRLRFHSLIVGILSLDGLEWKASRHSRKGCDGFIGYLRDC
jgi:hypothetical protein